MNRWRGEVAVRIDGQERVLRFTWDGIAALQSLLGADFDAKIADAIARVDTRALAGILTIGLRDRWPEVTVERILAASPPLTDVTVAIQVALARAFNGDDPPPRAKPENPPTLLGRIMAALSPRSSAAS